MFWRRSEYGFSGEQHDELRGYLTERLRLALEFATLGAYELTQAESAPDQQWPGQASEVSCALTRGPLRPHVGLMRSSCDSASSAVREQPACGWQARSRHGRRGGTVATPEQPCVWPRS
jgi:hypothetical protein